MAQKKILQRNGTKKNQLNPRKHFTFFAAESDILGVENDKKK